MNGIQHVKEAVKQDWLSIVEKETPDDKIVAVVTIMVAVLLAAGLLGSTGWWFLHNLQTGDIVEITITGIVFAFFGLGVGAYYMSATLYSGINYLRTARTPEDSIGDVTETTESEP